MTKRAIVIGAGGAVGESVCAHLLSAGWGVQASMRRRNEAVAARLMRVGAEVIALDLEAPIDASRFADVHAVVLAPILTLAKAALPALQAARTPRTIFFSSNNVAIDPAAPTYVKLAAAEAEVRAALPGAIILRPTLIYGDPRLTALTRIARLARRARVLPVPGTGRALQQPVFHDDLGRAAALLAASDAHIGATFALGGPEALSMAALFKAIARAAGRERAVVPTPRWILSLGEALLGRRFPFDAAQIARVEVDRLAVPQTPLPPEFAPSTSLSDGLARMIGAMDARA